MNKKAESFKKFLDEKKINDFVVEEMKEDDLHAVVFRSYLTVTGNNLNTILVLDDSVYSMIRVFVAPQAQTEKNRDALTKLINEYNMTYKAFKYFTDTDGNLILDLCMVNTGDTVDGELVYALYQTISDHLETAYKDLMKIILE
ncbi:YbjN domain-containing protein [Megasphaera lornae]|jgi:hypothetical protein|uniref:Bacterial sensory transduction regulator n=1 Tax=Megasphaera lornae TaxID=1000568 RepID=D3LX53_9FIRM|nr:MULTISPECIES: YbjN domain-containing protein [Megasphaera]EFD93237.1 hypothetical protein HMPREF0889_0109 [Megasphaera genomosp. type_1 str. 28L]EGL40285.1 hypothetical protein HMPREF1039_0759 [Megasphaera lornae]KXB90059.1 hypothetical protein HMPREF3033_01563 [Veillonellaceae bacterium DNF00751]MUP49872.1 hypothetical protein [Veillonellaceae bacterium M1-70]